MPLAALAARYLPQPAHLSSTDADADASPSGIKSKGKTRRQDLSRLVREVRREIVGWHLREGWLRGLRGGLGLSVSVSSSGDGQERDSSSRKAETMRKFGVRDVRGMDAEGLDVRIEWMDGKVGSEGGS